MIDALTDPSGIVAAVVVVLGVVVAVVGLIRPALDRRRASAEAAARLEVSHIEAEEPPPHSEAGTVSFNVQNAGSGVAVLNRLEFRVTGVGAVTEERTSEAAAPVPRFDFKVKLSPSTSEYDIRAKTFGSAPDHRYEEGEVESFLIEVTSTEPAWYELSLVVGWYDVSSPAEQREEVLTVDRLRFLPDRRGIV